MRLAEAMRLGSLIVKPARKGRMKELWYCAECLTERELDTHGRCSCCGSDALGQLGGGNEEIYQYPVYGDASRMRVRL